MAGRSTSVLANLLVSAASHGHDQSSTGELHLAKAMKCTPRMFEFEVIFPSMKQTSTCCGVPGGGAYRVQQQCAAVQVYGYPLSGAWSPLTGTWQGTDSNPDLQTRRS